MYARLFFIQLGVDIMNTTRFSFIVINFLLIMLFANAAYAIKPIYSGGKERAAIRGYDPVAYFTENEAIKGNEEITLEYEGATWFFSSESNRTLFEEDPVKYLPQYGGYCAYAASRGSSASSKPEYFTVYDDKLYLNYSKSVYNKWIKNKDKYIDKGDSNWPSILAK